MNSNDRLRISMKINTKYEILTPTGWQPFKGVTESETVLYSLLIGSKTIVASKTHPFFHNRKTPVQVQCLNVGDLLMTKTGFAALRKMDIIGISKCYDIIECADELHQFYIERDIITKNCDEFAFVRPNMASEFWTSIQPVLSTGGSCIITSTPKSDEDQFAQIWKGANDNLDEYGQPLPNGRGKNDFFPIKVPWYEHPERDETWARPFRQSLGPAKFAQEFECVVASTKLDLLDQESGEEFTMTMGELIQKLKSPK